MLAYWKKYVHSAFCVDLLLVLLVCNIFRWTTSVIVSCYDNIKWRTLGDFCTFFFFYLCEAKWICDLYVAWLISNPRLVVCESCMLSRQLNVVSFAECLVCIELPSIRILGRAEGKGDSTCRALDIIQHSLKRISFHQWLVLRGALCDILRHSCGKAFTKSESTDLRQSLSKVICTLSSWHYQVHCINRVMLTSSFVCSRNSMDFILDHIFL